MNAEIEYSALVGKPSETTLRFAEHRLTQLAKKMNIQPPLRTMYMIGWEGVTCDVNHFWTPIKYIHHCFCDFSDNVNSDITAANLYQRYVRMTSHADFPTSRQLPLTAAIEPQTVKEVHGILVRTGVYRDDQQTEVDHSHKDFRFEDMRSLAKPTVVVDNVLHAVEYILERELGSSKWHFEIVQVWVV